MQINGVSSTCGPAASSAGAAGRFSGPRGQVVLGAIADKLGMKADDVQSALQSGQSIQDLASAKGVSVQDLHAAVHSALQAQGDDLPAAQHHRHHHGGDAASGLDEQIGNKVLSVIADKLGESAGDLKSQLGSGQDLGKLLQDKGVSDDDLRTAIQQAVQSWSPYGQNGATQPSAATPSLQQVDAQA